MTTTSFTRLLKTLLAMEDPSGAPRTGHVGVPVRARVDLLLLAKYGADREFTVEERADARARVLDAMAGDIARQLANKAKGRAEARDSASASPAAAGSPVADTGAEASNQQETKRDASADPAEAFRKAGWKVGTGAPVTGRRKKPRVPGTVFPIPPMRISTSVGMRASGDRETASALGAPFKDEVVIGDRRFAAYVEVSADNEIILRGDFDKAWTKIVLFGNESEPYALAAVTGFDDARRCVGVGRLTFSDALDAAGRDPDKAIILK